MATMKIQADAVQKEDYITGLDNGFVVDVEEGDIQIGFPGNRQYSLLEGMVTITYHDAQGDENYLIMPPESMLTVERH